MLAKHPFFAHPLSARLADLGFLLEPWSITPGGSVAGLLFRTLSSEIVVTYDRVDRLRITYYGRLRDRVGAGNSFNDFVWLLREAAACGIRDVIGVVSPQRGHGEDVLPADRIAAFYTRYLGAQKIGEELGSDLILGDLSLFLQLYRRALRAARPARPQQACGAETPENS